jgi:hypothetical protein
MKVKIRKQFIKNEEGVIAYWSDKLIKIAIPFRVRFSLTIIVSTPW